MAVRDPQAEEFEQHREHLRAVAYRMLGSLSEADDAVQESWLRLNRAGTDGVENMAGWLTTVVARVCLDMLRARRARREDFLETLTPPERLAFVLHDMFGVPFEEIAPMVERTPTAARQLASRARRRVRGATPKQDPDLAEQRRVVDAFLAASRAGDFDALVAVLDPDVVFRIDAGGVGPRARPPEVGAEEVARRVLKSGRPFAGLGRPAIVNGAAGVVVVSHGKPLAVVAFTVARGRIAEIDVVIDPAKLRSLPVHD